MDFASVISEDQSMDWKLELVAVPVSDVDRAKAFYTDKVGFNADHDHHDHDFNEGEAAGVDFVEDTGG